MSLSVGSLERSGGGGGRDTTGRCGIEDDGSGHAHNMDRVAIPVRHSVTADHFNWTTKSEELLVSSEGEDDDDLPHSHHPHICENERISSDDDVHEISEDVL